MSSCCCPVGAAAWSTSIGCAANSSADFASSPSTYYLDDAQLLLGLLDDPPDELKPLAAYLAEHYGVDGARIMVTSWAAAMAAVIDEGGDISRSRAARITCPALLIAGTHDPFCPPALAQRMADAIPRGAFAEAEGGHDLHLSHGGWLAATVLDWLSDH